MSIIASEEIVLTKKQKVNERSKAFYTKYPEKRQKSSKEYLKTYMRSYMTEVYNPKKLEIANTDPSDIGAITAIKEKYRLKLKDLNIAKKCKDSIN